MNKKPIIFGIESSCDETAASILTRKSSWTANCFISTLYLVKEVHKEFGGVVPLAADPI